LTASSPIGIFMGCEYQDPVRGFVNAQMFPAGGIASGVKNVKFKIMDLQTVVMRVQSSGSVAATAIGMNAALVVGAGNAATGDSTFAAGAAAATTGIALRIVGFPDMPGSVPGDAFTDLLVMWNIGVHRLGNPLGQ
jgi:methyl coenzyme M reductase alpha subunit